MIAPEQQHGTDGSLATRAKAIIDRQHELLVRLEEMSRRQMGLLDDPKAERLLLLIGERQHVIDQLQKAGAMLDPLRDEWNSTLASSSPAEQDTVRRRLDAIAMLIDQINSRDEEARRKLGKRRDQIAIELVTIGKGRGAIAAYSGRSASRPAAFQDRNA